MRNQEAFYAPGRSSAFGLLRDLPALAEQANQHVLGKRLVPAFAECRRVHSRPAVVSRRLFILGAKSKAAADPSDDGGLCQLRERFDIVPIS